MSIYYLQEFRNSLVQSSASMQSHFLNYCFEFAPCSFLNFVRSSIPGIKAMIEDFISSLATELTSQQDA